MDARQQRGIEMAARFRSVQKGDVWRVPSATGVGSYSVRVTEDFECCDCPDFTDWGHVCKHVFAVRTVIQKQFEFGSDGTVTETETKTVELTETVRKTYKQDWPAYNAAQVEEKERFQSLLRDLCSVLVTPERRRGQQPIPPSDALFAVVFKVYSTLSGRRFMTDLRQAKEKGFVSEAASYNSICRYLEKPELTQLLKDLIVETSKPLKAFETDFAVDSSGFTTSRFESWYDHKYGATRRQHTWVKVHLVCGVKTNIVTAVEIKDKDAADLRQLPSLMKTTAQTFKPKEVSADKAYNTIENNEVIASLGATPFIPFKSTHTGRDKNKKGTGIWEKAFHYFQFQRDEFVSHYHKRSNVESTFSMIKRKFGDSVRSKADTAMVNESLCKILAHNIVVLIHEIHELGIDPVFWASPATSDRASG